MAHFRLCIFIIISLISNTTFTQPWMTDPNESGEALNFYKIQSDFNAYWTGKEIERGKGWKAFKRWEWYWENRVNQDGSFPPAGITLNNFIVKPTYLRIKKILYIYGIKY